MKNRWWIVGCGTLLQVCLGSVYAWSYFQKPLIDAYGWSNAQVTGTFSAAIGCLGLAAAVGGMLLPRVGPRTLAVTGSLLYGAGYLLSALALQFKLLPLLWIGYGLVGGIGLGLGYVTPVATVARWFPDRKGLATGMVVMGFGLGALLMSKLLAPSLHAATGGHLPLMFAGMGLVIGLTGLAGALGLRNPPSTPQATAPSNGWTLVRSRRFLLLWSVFFCNIVAGIAIISFQSPLLQELLRKVNPAMTGTALAAAGATLIAVSSVFNGLGRLFWGALSDRLGQLNTFRFMLASQVAVFVGLMMTGNPWVLGGLICYVLLCYGGGFGLMPSLVLKMYDQRQMAFLYGCSLTAWSAGGIVGPQMVAVFKDRFQGAASLYAFGCSAGLLAVGFLLALALRDSAHKTTDDVRLPLDIPCPAANAAHNLLAAMIDHHLEAGNSLEIDTQRIVWRRMTQVNDLPPSQDPTVTIPRLPSVPVAPGFDIAPSPEILASLRCASSIVELKECLGQIIVAYNRDGAPVTARDLKVNGLMATLMHYGACPKA
jgi:OFA family oxalate/formate antiporter-like MFS transporter